jgi:hypothetical protein
VSSRRSTPTATARRSPWCERIAAATGAAPTEVERLLGDERSAVLGVVPRLADLRAGGFQPAPADDRCVAAEVLVEPPAAGPWPEAACDVVALTPR